VNYVHNDDEAKQETQLKRIKLRARRDRKA